jgi:hypothetical protein
MTIGKRPLVAFCGGSVDKYRISRVQDYVLVANSVGRFDPLQLPKRLALSVVWWTSDLLAREGTDMPLY